MKKISRRSFLAAAGLSVAALALTACGGSSASTASSVASSAASSEAASTSAAAGELTTVEAGKLTMATNATFPPYEMTTDAGDIEGIDVETAQAIADKLGLELQIDDMDFDAALLSVQQGKADIVMAGVTVTDERKAVTAYAKQLQEQVFPDLRVAVLHGKMKPKEKEKVMAAFAAGESDILVSTTVVELGLDVPNATCMVVENADRFGLSQLHQIRGRVGRSNRRAFADLTYRKGKALSENSAKRLEAIREFAEFGSGFKIAMRDLEIRGAGNVLGPEQSGFMLSVGYDMYLKLLEEAVLTQQGQPVPKRTDCAANLTVAASIPDRYVPAQEQRMDLYRRIAALRTEQDADDLVDELIDRYGEPPRTVNNLISVALLRTEAAQAGITDIDQKNGSLLLTIPEFDLRLVSQLCGGVRYKGRLLFSAGEKPYLSLRLKKGEDALRAARALVADYAAQLE